MKNQNVYRNAYSYNVNTETNSDTFYFTQDKNGSIILIMNGTYNILTLSQIIDLNIVIQNFIDLNLIDFNYDNYKRYYKIK